jgi:biotin operon repressor
MNKDIISKKHLAETFGISESEMEKSMDQMVKEASPILTQCFTYVN